MPFLSPNHVSKQVINCIHYTYEILKNQVYCYSWVMYANYWWCLATSSTCVVGFSSQPGTVVWNSLPDII